MPEKKRDEKLASFQRAYEELSNVLKSLPFKMWNYKPQPDRWSVSEIIVHLADSEANAYIRFRKCIAESGKSIMIYDQAGWCKSLGYSNQNLVDALVLFRVLRESNYNFLKSLPESAWKRTIKHRENGVMSLTDLLDLYERHIEAHINQLKKIYADWKKKAARAW